MIDDPRVKPEYVKKLNAVLSDIENVCKKHKVDMVVEVDDIGSAGISFEPWTGGKMPEIESTCLFFDWAHHKGDKRLPAMRLVK